MFNIYINDENCKPPVDDEIYYIIGQNGIFLKKTIDLIDCMVPVNNISVLKKVDTYVRMNIPKIPQNIFSEIVSLFYYVHMVHKSECAVLLFYDKKTKTFDVKVPLQKVSMASVHYVVPPNYENYQKIGTIHSHSSMSAFHSSTDVDDEKSFDGIHMTIGKLNAFEKEKKIDIKCCIVANGHRMVVNPLDYVYGIKEVINEEPIITTNNYYKSEKLYYVKPILFNEDWVKNIVKEITLPTTPFSFSKFYRYGQPFENFKFSNGACPCLGCPHLLDKLELQDEFDEFGNIFDEEGKIVDVELEIDYSLFDEEPIS
jgi:hypothetical protein